MKKTVILGAVGIIVVVLGVGSYLFLRHPNQKPVSAVTDTKPTVMLAKDLLSVTDKGIINLYDVSANKVVDTLDLKTMKSVPEQKTQPQPTPQPTPQPKPTPAPEQSQAKSYQGFVEVPVVIKAGDSSWDIQKRLTPNRDTNEMLKLDASLNGDKKLHPIYPGENMVYLKEADNSVSAPQLTKTQPVASKPVAQPVQTTTNNYLLSKSVDLKSIYVYQSKSQTVYQVTMRDNKIKVTKLLQSSMLPDAIDFKVTPDNIFVLSNGNKVREINLKNPSQVYDAQLNEKVTAWVAIGNTVYYAYGDRMGKDDLSKNQATSILLGDTSKDMFVAHDKVYILNAFGSQKNNSILMKVDPNSMKVDNLVELKSSKNAILSLNKEQSTLYVGQMNDGIPNIVPIDMNSFAKGDSLGRLDYTPKAEEINGYVYVDNDGDISIYTVENPQKIKEFNLEGTEVLPLF